MAETMSNSEKIKPVALAIAKLCKVATEFKKKFFWLTD